ncbi:hypothetical protein L484_018835 [Morus notabilis]|uniref:Uncharacterized protein n=1 Tax=Morus notabilis TaxID=981085 RepID=W9SE44_9ROSA|nr:hypothetical protein L484_018835 [Morus notabilis]
MTCIICQVMDHKLSGYGLSGYGRCNLQFIDHNLLSYGRRPVDGRCDLLGYSQRSAGDPLVASVIFQVMDHNLLAGDPPVAGVICQVMVFRSETRRLATGDCWHIL